MVEWDANQIRSKISSFTRNGEVKLGQFQEKLGISANSYRAFMKQSGATKGQESDTYMAAHTFFSKRKEKGLNMPQPKRAKKDNQKNDKKAEKDFDVSDIELPGEKKDAVPIFDTCDDVRKKIEKHLKEPGVTQAGFCRELVKMFHVEEQSISPRQLSTFLGKKGPSAGNSTAVFYAAYCFFEKLRVKQGGKKTKKRKDMESVHPHGMSTVDCSRGIICHSSKRPVEDQYGKITFIKIR